MVNKIGDHCKNGHLLTQETVQPLYDKRAGKSRLYCKICRKDKSDAERAANSAIRAKCKQLYG